MSGHCWQYAYQVHYVWFKLYYINGDNDKFIELAYIAITSTVQDHFICRITLTKVVYVLYSLKFHG